jgi:hypothetical protein
MTQQKTKHTFSRGTREGTFFWYSDMVPVPRLQSAYSQELLSRYIIVISFWPYSSGVVLFSR